jgi:hypothetical protein
MNYEHLANLVPSLKASGVTRFALDHADDENGEINETRYLSEIERLSTMDGRVKRTTKGGR